MKNKNQDLSNNPKFKAILFFAIYFIFFSFLAVFSRKNVDYSSDTDNFDDNVSSSYNFSFAKIKNNNYKFNYNLKLDGNDYIYNGEAYNDKSNMEYNNLGNIKKYYINKDGYFVNENNIWVKSDSPYIFADFININVIEALIKKASFNYKTDYESGSKVYNYKITTNTINKLFTGKDMDIADEVNEIFIRSDENNVVDKVILKLNGYCKSLSLCNNELLIELNYDNFGEIKEITSPLD